MEVGPGHDCLPEGSRCVDGSMCVGTLDKKICVMPRSFGHSCGFTGFDICADGLDCVESICGIPNIPLGGHCSKPGSVCEAGTVCAGKKNRKKCVEPVRMGGVCSKNLYSVCETGYECIKRLCSLSMVPVGGDCITEGSNCAPGSVCVGDDTMKKCVTPGMEGGECATDSFMVCELGLECEDSMCVRPKIPGGGN